MALKVGDLAPHFTATSQDGTTFDSTQFIGVKPIVLYFYPKDNTRVCTAQACAFRDQYAQFKDYGAEVIGISSDSLVSHQKFATQYRLPFILLSDSDAALRKLFGVPDDLFGLLPGRATYVVDRQGRIQMIFDSMSGTIHIEKALECIQRMK